MSTLFEVPCPECVRQMLVHVNGRLECPICRRVVPRAHGTPVRRQRASEGQPRRSTATRGCPTGDPGAVVRIAQVAPLYEAVPPGAYGGTERIIATLCDGLVAQGHEVTLFAPETSETAAVLEAYGEPLRTRFEP